MDREIEMRARECLAQIVEADAAVEGRAFHPGKATAYYIRDGQGVDVKAWAAIRAMVAFATSELAATSASPADGEEGSCELCKGACRGHSLGHPEQWVPEEGSAAALSTSPLPGREVIVREVAKLIRGGSTFTAEEREEMGFEIADRILSLSTPPAGKEGAK